MVLLEEYEAFSKSVHNKAQSIRIMLLQVIGHKKMGDEKAAIEMLIQAIDMASEGWIMPFTELIKDISELLAKLKLDGVMPEFIDQVFEATNKYVKVGKQKNTSLKLSNDKRGRENLTKITSSELKVLKYIAEGLRNQEIAEKLFNSEETIKKHIYHMFQKLSVKNRLSLVRKAKEKGIL